MIGIPAGLVAIGVFYRRHERRHGVGARSRQWLLAALVVVVLLWQLAGLFVAFAMPLAVVGLCLLLLGMNQRVGLLIAVGGVLAVVGALEGWHVVSNRIGEAAVALGANYHSSVVQHAEAIVAVLVGVVLLVVGLIAYRREATA